ncbi:MAG: hypothetical protein AB1465_00025 [Patescibacteria group bacterium]
MILVEPIGLFLGVFALILFFVILISKFFIKRLWQKPLWLKSGIFFGITHFILTTITLIHIWLNLKNEAELGMVWSFFIYGDFPISLLLFTNFFRSIFEATITSFVSLSSFDNLIFPYIVFGFFGSMQYCLLGGLIGKLIEKIRIRSPGSDLHFRN